MAQETTTVIDKQLTVQVEEAKVALANFRTILEGLKNDPQIAQLLQEGKLGEFESEEAYTQQEEYRRGYCNCCQQEYPCVCRKCDRLKAEGYKDLALFWNSVHDLLRILDAAGEEFEDAGGYLLGAIKHFAWAEACSRRNCCECHCRH
ncbi:MAG: hypothetical protein AB9856_13830 [Cellulosilyticaceae bacterium]